MGGGISAMPSMHLAAAAIYVIASRGTKWFYPSILFWLIIFIASGYFGYHYWVDGFVGAVVAWICWTLSARLVTGLASRPDASPPAPEPS
jgi:membrane-associated phospholipid phosphatase